MPCKRSTKGQNSINVYEEMLNVIIVQCCEFVDSCKIKITHKAYKFVHTLSDIKN